MSRKSKMLNTSVLLLLHEIVINSMFFIQILVNIHLTYIMEQVKIKIIHLTFLKLFLKNLFHFRHISKVITRKFRRKIKGLSRILLQKPSHNQFGIAAMIPPCSIVIINSMFHSVGNHLFCRRLINLRILSSNNRKTHCSHPKRRQLHTLKIFVNHYPFSFLPDFAVNTLPTSRRPLQSPA